jgi:DNA-binding transcriptional regulator YhcF (GntR family)
MAKKLTRGWEELTAEEKIETLRSELTVVQQGLDRQKKQIETLTQLLQEAINALGVVSRARR